MTRTIPSYVLFERMTRRPVRFTLMGLLFIALTASGLTQLIKDTSVEAFIPPDHPALLANETTTQLFGLSEPIAIGVFRTDGASVFDQPTLQLIDALTVAVSDLGNIREDRVASITTESSIQGRSGAILIDPYFDPYVSDQPQSAERRWLQMPPHIGTLVSEDQTGAVIMAELLDQNLAVETYQAVLELAESMSTQQIQILVAGPAAVSGYLSTAIDEDARLLQPMVFIVVLLFLYFAFMRSSALLGPIIVLIGSAGGALGLMAWQGIPYFAITNALPVILVAISVADAIHILSAYFERRSTHPDENPRLVVVHAVSVMARPITLTTVTTMAGFLGIAVMSIMPPIAYFAWYAMLGVLLAWLFSLFVLPNVLVLVQPKPSRLFANYSSNKPDWIGEQLGKLSLGAGQHPHRIIIGFALLLGTAAFGAAQLKIDRSQVDNFATDEPIRQADERIHKSFAGTAFLDVIVKVENGTLLEGGRMQKIAALQNHLETQPHVSKSVSIVDYLSLLDAAIHERNPATDRSLPQAADSLAQYLMVYESSADPTDFEEEITPDYQTALIRNVLDSHYFSDSRTVVSALENYLQKEFNTPEMYGVIAGDVNVAYHWMTSLELSHFAGVGLSLLLVLLMSILVFRSVVLGFIAVLPVSATILCLYGVMGYLGIYLEPATSMFAAIAVGVGVDFAIHLMHRLRSEHASSGDDALEVIRRAVPSTARACFFNASALGIGFAVLLISDLPTLKRFGGLVAIASLASFITALVLVPACHTLWVNRGVSRSKAKSTATTAVGFLLACATLAPLTVDAETKQLTGRQIAERVANRVEPTAVVKTIEMQLINKRGQNRERQAIVYRFNKADYKNTRITYLAPKTVRELTFLARDFQDSTATDQRWLYVPAARKVRRIPASNRGDYFLGTDFSYEDVQSDFKFELADYAFTYEGEARYQDHTVHRIKGRPATARLARQLGHDGFSALIDPESWFPRQIEFFHKQGRPLKTIQVTDLAQIHGIWTAKRIEAEHHRTGHKTVFNYININHEPILPSRLFSPTELNRGLAEITP